MPLLELIDQLGLGGTPRHYKPGQGERYSVQALLDGVLDSTVTPSLVIHSPDGWDAAPIVTSDGTGTFHADYALPSTATDGVWVARWSASGIAPTNDACVERRFIVDPRDFLP